jgi:hypothetical protein
MENRHNLLMILIQIGVGSVSGVVPAVAGYFLTNGLFLNTIVGDRVEHGFWVGLFTLLAFLLTYCSGVVGSAYGIKQVAKQFGQDCNLKHAWQGAFLGPPALAVLVMTTQLNWQTLTESFGVNSLLSLIIVIIRPLAQISSFPVSVLLKNGIPVELLYTLSAPIGAIVGYRFDWHRSGEISEAIRDNFFDTEDGSTLDL